MKTLEQKAKAYDEALERAKKLHKDALTLQLEQDIKDYEYIFPELKESEDEKIRNIIIRCLKGNMPDNNYRKECIAWLEKQELKSNPYSGVSFSYNGNIWGMCARDNGIDISFNDKLIQHISGEKQCEQKPVEWSEEDEKKSSTTKEKLQALSDGKQHLGWLEDANKVMAEEDCQMIDALLHHIQRGCSQPFDVSVISLEDWLKSLKERHTWKPSDEQMDALCYVYQHYTPNVTDRLAWDSIKTLELMYQDLKKLRGE